MMNLAQEGGKTLRYPSAHHPPPSFVIILKPPLPPGETTDDVLDVSRRAEVSTMDDYDNVPIEQYGLAMLRGMGWKPGTREGGAWS